MIASKSSARISIVISGPMGVDEPCPCNSHVTTFAPTDDAFEALGLTPDNIDSLDQDALTQILLYHVARGRRDAEAVVESSRIRTLQGGFLMQSGGILTDKLGREAKIIVTDVPATNGIIHVIDAVLLPFAP